MTHLLQGEAILQELTNGTQVRVWRASSNGYGLGSWWPGTFVGLTKTGRCRVQLAGGKLVVVTRKQVIGGA